MAKAAQTTSDFKGDHLSVKMFGAVGTGGDDTAALNAAFAAAQNLPGCSLLIPSGTYGISSPLAISTGFEIVAGKYVTIQALASMPCMATVGDGAAEANVRAQTGYLGSMEGVTWDGNSLASNGLQIGTFAPATNVFANGYRFDSLKVLNCLVDGVVTGDNVWAISFYSPCIMRCASSGIHSKPDATAGANLAIYSGIIAQNGVGLKIDPIPNVPGSESQVSVYGTSFGDNTSWAIQNGDSSLDASLWAAQLLTVYGSLIEQAPNWLSNDGIAGFHGCYFQNGSSSGVLGWLIQNGGVLNIIGGRISNGGSGSVFRSGDVQTTTFQVVGWSTVPDGGSTTTPFAVWNGSRDLAPTGAVFEQSGSILFQLPVQTNQGVIDGVGEYLTDHTALSTESTIIVNSTPTVATITLPDPSTVSAGRIYRVCCISSLPVIVKAAVGNIDGYASVSYAQDTRTFIAWAGQWMQIQGRQQDIIATAINYTISAGIRVVIANTSASALTITLPDATVGLDSPPIQVVATGVNPVTIAAAGGTISGPTSYTNDTHSFVASGGVWYTSQGLLPVGTAGTYTKVTTDAEGRVTSGSTIATTDLPNTGIPGTYSKVTTNAQGLVTAGTSASLTTDVTGTLQAGQFPALTGDITTSAGSLATSLKAVGTAGTYTKVTTDSNGRVSSGTTLSASDIPSLSSTYAALAGAQFSGNVGIGVSATVPLQINSGTAGPRILYLQGANHGLRLGDGSSFAIIDGVDNSNGATSYQPLTITGSTLGLGVSGAAVVNISSGSRVLVGTSSDDGSNKLQVNGATKITGALAATTTITATSTLTGASLQIGSTNTTIGTDGTIYAASGTAIKLAWTGSAASGQIWCPSSGTIQLDNGTGSAKASLLANNLTLDAALVIENAVHSGGITLSGTPTAARTVTFQDASGTVALTSQTPSGILTTLGDLLYENSTPAPVRLAGNTTATKNFLTQTGTGAVSAAPAWGTLAAGDIPDISATYSKIPTVFRWTGQTTTLAAQNLRTGSGPLAAGAYRVGVIISPSPTGSASVQTTIAWTDVRGNSMNYGLGFSGSGALPTQVSLNIEVDGVHDVTIAVVSVTGTITYNLTATLERLG